MPLEGLLHHAALNALAAAMNQPDLTQSGLVRRVDVFLHHRRDVARRKRVEVEVIFDGDAVVQIYFVRLPLASTKSE